MKIKLFSIVLCILLLTGCWDKRELNELGIVLAMGIDKDANTGKYSVTLQIVRPSALKQKGSSKGAAVELVTSKGDTIFEAIRGVSQQFDRRPFFAQNKVVIFSEQVAREGLSNVMDILLRSQEIRRLSWVIIAKNTTAEELLGIEHGIGEIQAEYLTDMIKNISLNSEASSVSLLEYVKRSTEGINPIAGVMEIIHQPILPIEEKKGSTPEAVKFSGTAAFKSDKLVGYLNDKETRGLNWITGNINSTALIIPAPNEEGKFISIEVKHEATVIKPEIKDGTISFNIKIKVTGNLVEHQGTSNIIDVDTVSAIEKEQQDVIENEIKAVIDKTQKDLNSDIFGFGVELSYKYPKEWKKIKDNWDRLFHNVKYTVNTDSKIDRPGTLLRPYPY